MAELTMPQMKALRAAALFALDAWIPSGLGLDDAMRLRAGKRWRTNLRKALGEVSRELAKATYLKGRKR